MCIGTSSAAEAASTRASRTARIAICACFCSITAAAELRSGAFVDADTCAKIKEAIFGGCIAASTLSRLGSTALSTSGVTGLALVTHIGARHELVDVAGFNTIAAAAGRVQNP